MLQKNLNKSLLEMFLANDAGERHSWYKLHQLGSIYIDLTYMKVIARTIYKLKTSLDSSE